MRAVSRSTTQAVEAALATSRPIRRARRRSRSGAPDPSAGNLTQRIAEIEARLTGEAGRSVPGSELADEALANVALRIYKGRRRRAHHLPPELLGEPAWDILLDLFVALVRGKRIRTSSAVLAARTPGSTGLRWLAALERHGLVERCDDLADRRVRLIRLSPLGYRLMRAYLAEGIDAGELPAGRFLRS